MELNAVLESSNLGHRHKRNRLSIFICKQKLHGSYRFYPILFSALCKRPAFCIYSYDGHNIWIANMCLLK